MDSLSEISPVRSAHSFDVQSLLTYCTNNLKNFSPSSFYVQKFTNGQSNPTFLLRDGNDSLYVLRKKPPGQLLSSAHAVDREYRIINVLYQQEFPVPKPLLYCSDASIIGTPFYIMEFVRGRIFRDPLLPEVVSAKERAEIYDEMNSVLARLHTFSYRDLSLHDFGRPGNYFSRQIARWTAQYKASATSHIQSMENLMLWLPKHVPDEDGSCIVHGDYRLDNMIFHPTQPKVIAVLDWELCTIGNPLSDLAYNCMPYYTQLISSTETDILRPEITVEGIPQLEDFISAYCKRTNRQSINNWHFFIAFSFFRGASIAQGVYARSLQGNASSEIASQFKDAVPTYSNLAWKIILEADPTASNLTTVAKL